MSEPLLVAEKLAVVYHHAITAIQGVSLTVAKGQIVAILGTNGAGKSTTLRALSGFLGIDSARVTEGSVTFKGEHIENRPPNEVTRLGIVLIPEREKVFPNLTVSENLSAPFAPAMSKAEREITRGTGLFLLPAPRRPSRAYRRPALRRRAADARARERADVQAELLLVDELSLGLAPVIVEDLMARLVQIRNELGITIVIVEQSASIALDIADYGYVLENGRVVLDGSADKLKSTATSRNSISARPRARSAATIAT